jgi:glycosyltransferase involved in cell wall biosynthesis
MGGSGEVVREVSERLVARGHDVTVATSTLEERSSREHAGVSIVEFPISGNLAGGFRGDTNGYLDFLRTANVDLMMNYALQQWTADLALLAAPELTYGKVMTTCGLSGLHMPAFDSYFRYLHFHLRHFDRLIFHSASYRDAEYAKKHGLDNTAVIPNAVRAEEFAVPPPSGFRARHGIPEDAFLVLTVANYTGGKGQDELIEIIDQAHIGRTTVLLVGKNFIDPRPVEEVMAKPIARLLAHSGGDKTAICMQLPRDEVVQAFFAADLFLFPSLIECSPLVLFETSAAGTPFISSDVGNAREIAEWTGCGLIAPGRMHETGHTFVDVPKAARMVEELFRDPDRRRAMAARGRKNVLEHYTWDKIVDQYEALYLDVVKRRRGGRHGEDATSAAIVGDASLESRS